MSNDEPSREELENRVEQLEQTVQRMLPDRRQTLKGLGLLGGGAIVGGLGGSASASTGSAGQIGTTTDRPDFYGDAADLNSVSTAEINNSGSGISVNDTLAFASGDGIVGVSEVEYSGFTVKPGSEVGSNDWAFYVSDGSDGFGAGDLIVIINDGTNQKRIKITDFGNGSTA